MKFLCTIDVALPRNLLLALWQDPRKFKDWQGDFVHAELLSGSPGQVGARTKKIYLQRDRKQYTLIETILAQDLPGELVAHYEAEMMSNTMTHRFLQLGAHLTRWEVEIRYHRFQDLGLRLLAILYPGMFRSQVQRWQLEFREFAEKQLEMA